MPLPCITSILSYPRSKVYEGFRRDGFYNDVHWKTARFKWHNEEKYIHHWSDENDMSAFERIANRRRSFPKVDLTQGRSIAYSRSMTRRVMELIDANGQGNVHGGVIMRMVDESAAIVAIKHSQCPTVVTASVERFDFLAPAFIGDVVSVNCEMHYAGRTSMEIGVEVTAEDLISREVRKIASSFVIYVALDENRKPTPVPPLLPADDDEKALIERAHLRRLHRQKRDQAVMQKEESDA